MMRERPEPKRLPSEADVLRALIECVPDPVAVIGADGETLLQNARARAIFPDPTPSSLSEWDKCFADHSVDGAAKTPPEGWPLARALRGETVMNAEALVTLYNDPARPTMLKARATPVRTADGTISGAVLICEDVTAQRRTERDLAQAQRMEAIGQLATGVAHDFNNILTAINALAETLKNSENKNERQTQIANRIAAAADQGGDLVKRLLSFARRQPMASTRVEVNPLVEELVSLLRVTLGAHIEIITDLNGDGLTALADPSQLSNALLNLAVNARDAMPNGGELVIRTSQEKDKVLIEVTDTGIGIPFDLQARVFEPFYTTKAPGQGTGLGLAIVYGFVAQAGGALELQSAPGRGASVFMRLPLAT